MEPLIIAVFAVVLLGTLVPIIVLAVRLQKKNASTEKVKWEELAEKLGATHDGKTLSGLYQEESYKCEYVPGAKNSPSILKVTLEHSFPCKMTIRKENAADRFAKRIGLVAELNTGDEQFDKDYYIDTPALEFARHYLRDEEKRSAVRKAFSAHEQVKAITFAPESLQVSISPCRLIPDEVNPALIADVVPLLYDLAQDLPRGMTLSETSGDSVKLPLVPLALTAFLSLIAGVLLLVQGMLSYHPLDWVIYFYPFCYSLPALAIFLFLSFVLLRGHSSSGKWYLLVGIFALIGIPMLGMGGTVFANGYLDDSAAVQRVLPVVEKRVSRSSKSTNYLIKVPCWSEEGGLREINVGNCLYNRLQVGRPVRLVTRSGELGFEWLECIECVP